MGKHKNVNIFVLEEKNKIKEGIWGSVVPLFKN